MQISLKAFLRSGRLNDLGLGMTKVEMTRILGQLEMVGGTSLKHRSPVIFKYANLEIFFQRTPPHECIGIYIETSTRGTRSLLPECFDVQEWGLSPDASRKEVELYLQTNEIDFQVTPQPGRTQAVFTIVSSGVVISFDDEEDSLWAISMNACQARQMLQHSGRIGIFYSSRLSIHPQS